MNSNYQKCNICKVRTHFVEFQGLPSKPSSREDNIANSFDASFIVLFQAETEELSGTEEHKNAEEILETTVLEDQDFDRSVQFLPDYSEC